MFEIVEQRAAINPTRDGFGDPAPKIAQHWPEMQGHPDPLRNRFPRGSTFCLDMCLRCAPIHHAGSRLILRDLIYVFKTPAHIPVGITPPAPYAGAGGVGCLGPLEQVGLPLMSFVVVIHAGYFMAGAPNLHTLSISSTNIGPYTRLVRASTRGGRDGLQAFIQVEDFPSAACARTTACSPSYPITPWTQLAASDAISAAGGRPIYRFRSTK